MKRLLKSSNFWNAVFFSLSGLISIISIVLIFKHIGGEEGIDAAKEVIRDFLLYQFIIFSGRTAVTGISDILKSRNNVTFDEEKGVDVKIK